MRYLSIWLVINFVTAYDHDDLTCPYSGQWELRARAKNCSNKENYICLFDAVQLTFDENCKGPQLERKGNKPVLNKGNFDRIQCSPTHYQPLQFFSFGNTNCTHLKSPCSEEGQVIADNGTSYGDRSCRCDYRQGYAFINDTSVHCSCMPSKEDCTCYLKTCSVNEVLSPDYDCINETQHQGTYQCPSIFDRGSHTPATDLAPVDDFVSITCISYACDTVNRDSAAIGCIILLVVILVFSVSLCCCWNQTERIIWHCWTILKKYSACCRFSCRKVHFVNQLESNVKSFEGKKVTFTCKINQEDILGKWYKGEKELTNLDSNITITNEGKIHELVITCVRLEDSGEYSFEIMGKHSSSHLIVSVDIIRHLQKNVQCIETENVTLTCEVSNGDVPGKWFKNANFKSTTKGKIHKLEIPSATVDDTATYSFEIGDSVSSTQLTVLKVDVLRHLEENVECNEGDRVTFTCELNHKDIPGKWFRSNKELSHSDSISFKVDGTQHELIIYPVKFEDRGYYSLHISDKPVSSSTLTVLELVTPEEVNYLRLFYLLETEAESVVRQIFDEEFHPQLLRNTLDLNKMGKLNRLRQKKHINRAEFDVLFPKVAEYCVKFRLHDYDISMVKDKTEKEKLEKKIETAVTTLYSAVKGIQTIKVLCFEPGSLVVVLTLTSKQFYDTNILQDTIESAVNGGRIESLLTERSGFSFQMIGNNLEVSSKDFDIRLMMTLMKNLAELDISEKPPLTGNTDARKVDWLSTIKYFRNKLVQNSNKKISDKEFEKDWNELSKAVIQLGGEKYKKICNDRKTFKPSTQQCQNYLHSENLQSDHTRTSVESINDYFIRETNIQTLAKEAVRERFDKQFVPGKLFKELADRRKHLESLKEERVITPSQWDTLFPTDKDSLSSARFDMKVMIILLRNTSFKNTNLFETMENLQNHLSRSEYDYKAIKQAIKDIKEEE